jgi:hypothetical protein
MTIGLIKIIKENRENPLGEELANLLPIFG